MKIKNADKAPDLQTVIFATATLLISSCAARDAGPVATSQPQDARMACAQIQAVIAGNNQLISDLGSEKGAKAAKNVIVGVVGIIVPVPWFGMDFKRAASTDQEALKQRNIYPASMATSERCGSPTTTVATASPQVPTAPQPTPATTSAPVSLVPTPATVPQPVAHASPTASSSPVAAPAQATTATKPPVIYTFTHASDASGPDQSPEFDDMTNSVANGNVTPASGTY